MADKSGPAPALKPKGKAKKKKVGAGNSTLLWTTRLGQKYSAYRATFLDVASGLKSTDVPTRRMATLFVASSLGLFAVALVASYHFLIAKPAVEISNNRTDEGKNLGRFFEKQADEAKKRFLSQNLGTFTLELKGLPNQKPIPGVNNVAEIEIVVECDSRETCDFVSDNLPKARNQITNVFTGLDREELLSREGKRKIKKEMLERMNLWLPRGRIENLFFSKLVLS